MEKRTNSLEEEINFISELFIEKSKNKEILIVSHFDTDGISSAAIMIQSLKELDKRFSVKIVKSLEEDFIYSLPKEKIILFLDLGSGILSYLKKAELKDVFIIDHHEIFQSIPPELNIINPQLNGKEEISSSSLVYLFCKQLNEENKELAKLAILGMIGDSMEKSIDKLHNLIISAGELL